MPQAIPDRSLTATTDRNSHPRLLLLKDSATFKVKVKLDQVLETTSPRSRHAASSAHILVVLGPRVVKLVGLNSIGRRRSSKASVGSVRGRAAAAAGGVGAGGQLGEEVLGEVGSI